MSKVRTAEGTSGFDRELWRRFVEMGGDRVATATGGGSLRDAVIIGMEVGRRLAPLPYAEAAAGRRFAEGVGIQLADSDVVIVLFDDDDGSGALLVTAGSAADVAVVVRDDAAYVVDPRQMNGRRIGNLAGSPWSRWSIPRLAQAPVASVPRHLRRAYEDDLRLLQSALLVGSGEQALQITVDYVRTRHQFGQPVGTFQALQHRLATCAAQLCAARLLTLQAAGSEGADRSLVAAAAVCAADAAELAAREGLQMHGGYGYTLEYDIHLFLLRITAWRVLLRAGALEDALPRTPWPSGSAAR